VGLQAVPGGDRIGRLLGVEIAPRGGGRKRGRRRVEEIAQAEAREADVGMDIAADLGVDEPRTMDV
jgi:hypothetical protein